MIVKTTTPDNNRIDVKLPASILLSPSANLHRIEFPAKANNDSIVKKIILMIYPVYLLFY